MRGRLWCVAVLAAGILTAMFLPAPAQAADGFKALAGDYVVVSVRRSSMVSAPASLRPGGADSPFGKRISFDASGVTLDGISCDDWQAAALPSQVDFDTDPMLADLRLPPTDSPNSVGDKRIGKSWRISCEGETFTTLYQADRRVLAMSWANSAMYLILERPMSTTEVTRLQKSMKSMKFYDGEITGTLDTGTERAVRAWYEYRLSDPGMAIPRRPAITENLLDALGVLK